LDQQSDGVTHQRSSGQDWAEVFDCGDTTGHVAGSGQYGRKDVRNSLTRPGVDVILHT
jgi:hypothetical protein